jgi:hypothetical protein
MSKSKFGGSNLYMTTREFADLVVTALEDQNYFRSTDPCHPQDIAQAFVTVGETIGAAMAWAIKEEHEAKNKLKESVMKTGDLKKNTPGSWSTSSSSTVNPTVVTNNYSYSHVHAKGDSILPPILKEEEPPITEEDSLGYSEWKRNGYL